METNEQKDTAVPQPDEWQKKAEEYLAGWQRAKADFINREKEHERRLGALGDFVTAGCLRALLPSFTGLEQACAHIPEGVQPEWVKGLLGVKKSFEDAFSTLGVTRIETVGKTLNPMQHEVIGRRKVDGTPTDTIVEEVAGGYMINGKMLLPAKVIVAE